LREGTSGESSAAVLEALAAGVPVLTNLATAAEYPEGTVAHVASADPEVVASRLADLLGRPDERRALSEAGQRFAASHQFGDLARTLMSLVTG
jgi:glycosyltransferase involved in cell wall biosynthesis